MTTGHIGLLGGGVIGGGWAARFLLNGHDVVMFDPDPEAPRKVGEVLANARRANAKLTMAQWPKEGSLRIVTTVEEAVEGARFVQESAPERLELKQQLFATASRIAGPDVVFGSSTSGLLPDRDAARHGASRAAGCRPSVQPGVPHAAGRGLWRRADLRRHQASTPPTSIAASACIRWSCRRRSTDSSPTG